MSELYDEDGGEPVYDEELDSRLDALVDEVESGGLPGESPVGVNRLDDNYSADSL